MTQLRSFIPKFLIGFAAAASALVSVCAPVAQELEQDFNNEESGDFSSESNSDIPASMGALGDSITAGALADHRRTDAKYPWVEAWVVGQLLGFLVTKNFAAIERKDYSWSTGMNVFKPVNSHAWRLNSMRKRGNRMKIYNAAVSGYESKDVIRDELPRMIDWSRKNLGQEAPDYVTMLIGPNDICQNDVSQMVPPGQFKDNISHIMDTILKNSPKTRMLISAIPNVESLRNVAKDSDLALNEPIRKCEDLWRIGGFCHTLTMEADPAKRAQIAQRVRDYNGAIKQLVEQNRKELGDRVRFAGRPYEVKFTPNDISVDCFHPNPDGQNMIAEQTWSSSWWAGIK